MRETKIKTLVCVIIGFRVLSCCDAQQDALSHVTNSPCSRNLVFDYIYRRVLLREPLLISCVEPDIQRRFVMLD